MRRIVCFLLLVFLAGSINATAVSFSFSGNAHCSVSDTIAPKVFLIGEYEPQFEKLMVDHEMLLMTACDNDMNIAFEKWQSMLQAMETHSDNVNYDLKGVKLWINIFWAEDGHIDHIAYYLKPNSRNVDTDKLTLFFISFMNNYQFPLIVGEKFSHYGVASFPTFARPHKSGEGKSNGIDPLVKDSVKSGRNE